MSQKQPISTKRLLFRLPTCLRSAILTPLHSVLLWGLVRHFAPPPKKLGGGGKAHFIASAAGAAKPWSPLSVRRVTWICVCVDILYCRQVTTTITQPLEHSHSRFEFIRFDSLRESIPIDSFCKKIGLSIHYSCHAVLN